jgi:hypothetical protein
MAGAMAAQTTWLVMLRDVSRTIRVRGEKRVAACMVVDMDSGDVLGIHMDRSDAEAVETALRNAVREPANRQRPKSPDRIVCSREIAPRVKELAAKLGAAEVIVAPPIPEGEEIFDSFIGHMSGRKQPREFASPDEWRLLFETALRYCEAEPWMRWGDAIDLEIEVEVDRVKQRYAGVVIGQGGIQRGLALYPGDAVPAGVRDWEEGKDVAMPPGTLLLHLDPPTEPPAEFVAKADRYGWPQDADFLPVIISIGDAGPADLGRQDVRRLVLSTVAVVELDRRGPVVAASMEPIAGRLQFPDGSRGSWSIRQRPGEQPEPGTLHIRLHQVGFDLVPKGCPVSMGSMPADVLPELRGRAKIHRPAPNPPPKRASSIPIIAIHPHKASGDALASRIANDDPWGVSLVEDGRHALAVLACAEGAHGLMEVPTDAAALVLFQGRLRSAAGFHVVFVADKEVTPTEGTVYGMFECIMPVESPAKLGRKPAPKPRRKRR